MRPGSSTIQGFRINFDSGTEAVGVLYDHRFSFATCHQSHSAPSSPFPIAPSFQVLHPSHPPSEFDQSSYCGHTPSSTPLLTAVDLEPRLEKTDREGERRPDMGRGVGRLSRPRLVVRCPLTETRQQIAGEIDRDGNGGDGLVEMTKWFWIGGRFFDHPVTRAVRC